MYVCCYVVCILYCMHCIQYYVHTVHSIHTYIYYVCMIHITYFYNDWYSRVSCWRAPVIQLLGGLYTVCKYGIQTIQYVSYVRVIQSYIQHNICIIHILYVHISLYSIQYVCMMYVWYIQSVCTYAVCIMNECETNSEKKVLFFLR
jgi:hypothetical protein